MSSEFAVDTNETPKPRRLTAAAASGMSWSYLSVGAIAVIQLVYVTVMSRLLDPVAFGLMAIANLAINFGHYFTRMGVAQALIQRPTITRDDVRAGFTAGLGLGVICFVVLWVVAPWVSGFFTEPDAIPLLRLMGLHFVFAGLAITSQGLLRRELRFRELAISQVASYFLGYGVVGLSLAAAGGGVWSLPAGVLTTHFLAFVFQYLWSRHPVLPTLQVRQFRSLYSFGARVSLLNFMEFLGKQLDTFSVGRYTTTALLGQYSRAFVVVNLPLSQHLSQALSRVLFPSFSKIQDDAKRLKRAYLSVLTLGGMIMFSLAAGMAVAAREIVLVLLGGQWDTAATVIPFFAFAIAFNIMTYFADLLGQAKAELNKILALQVIYLAVLAAGYVAVSGLGGVVPFAAALVLGEVGRHVAFLVLMGRLIGLRFAEVARAYAPAVVAASGVGIVIALGRQALLAVDAPVVLTLAAEIGLGAIALALFTRLNPFPNVRTELRTRLQAANLIGGRKRFRTRVVRLLVGPERLPAKAAP